MNNFAWELIGWENVFNKLVAKKDGFLDEVVIVQAKRDTEKTYYEITIGNDTATYLVEGVIMNRENGQPIAGASVKLINKMIHFVTEATTDSLGKYVYRLRKGYDYYVLAKKNGFLLNTITKLKRKYFS